MNLHVKIIEMMSKYIVCTRTLSNAISTMQRSIRVALILTVPQHRRLSRSLLLFGWRLLSARAAPFVFVSSWAGTIH